VHEHTFKNVGWTVGTHCNATCGHCYSWKARRNVGEFLTRGDVDRIVRQLTRIGVETVNLGGNEPVFTHGPNIRETLLPYIIRALHEAGIIVGLTTNGVSFNFLDAHNPEELCMLNDVDFSLDSPVKDEHDINRGAKLYGLVTDAIARANELGIACSIITCGMRKNFTLDYLSGFLALANSLGCEFRVNTLKPVEPALVLEMPDPDQFYEAFGFLMENSHCITLGESCITAFTGTGHEGCPCGSSSFRICGKTEAATIPITPCVYLTEFSCGDLLTDDIEVILRAPAFEEFAQRRTLLPTACREMDCRYLGSCRGGCAARAFLVNGTLDSKDPYCPHEYVRRHGATPHLPSRPQIGCETGVRVHDNYLCTWIGLPSSDFVDERFGAPHLPAPEEGAGHRVRLLSGCRQVSGHNADGSPSLVRAEPPSDTTGDT
jgi:radical SAM protein with 4Fe4S-binding SPASM domain